MKNKVSRIIIDTNLWISFTIRPTRITAHNRHNPAVPKLRISQGNTTYKQTAMGKVKN